MRLSPEKVRKNNRLTDFAETRALVLRHKVNPLPQNRKRKGQNRSIFDF